MYAIFKCPLQTSLNWFVVYLYMTNTCTSYIHIYSCLGVLQKKCWFEVKWACIECIIYTLYNKLGCFFCLFIIVRSLDTRRKTCPLQQATMQLKVLYNCLVIVDLSICIKSTISILHHCFKPLIHCCSHKVVAKWQISSKWQYFVTFTLFLI